MNATQKTVRYNGQSDEGCFYDSVKSRKSSARSVAFAVSFLRNAPSTVHCSLIPFQITVGNFMLEGYTCIPL